MELLTTEEAEVCMAAGHADLDKIDEAITRHWPRMPETPQRATEQILLAKHASRRLFKGRRCLHLVRLTDVWYEFPGLFERFRSDALETTYEKPGTVTESDENDFLTGLIAIGLYFLWDFLVIDEQHERLLCASHDERFLAGCISAGSKGIRVRRVPLT